MRTTGKRKETVENGGKKKEEKKGGKGKKEEKCIKNVVPPLPPSEALQY